jgi:hypothetical protein
MAFLIVMSNTENHNFTFCDDHLKMVQKPGKCKIWEILFSRISSGDHKNTHVKSRKTQKGGT